MEMEDLFLICPLPSLKQREKIEKSIAAHCPIHPTPRLFRQLSMATILADDVIRSLASLVRINR